MKYEYRPDPWQGVFVGYARRSRLRSLVVGALAVAVYGSLTVGLARVLGWLLWSAA